MQNPKNQTAETRSMAWKDRLDLALRGLPPDDEKAAAPVRSLRDYPLIAYLKDDPELYARLRSLYAPPPRTFGEAAAVIDALSRDPKRLDTALELMRRFAAPIRQARLLR